MYKKEPRFVFSLFSNLIGNRICHVYFINSEDFFCPVRGISLFKMSFIFADTDFIIFCYRFDHQIDRFDLCFNLKDQKM